MNVLIKRGTERVKSQYEKQTVLTKWDRIRRKWKGMFRFVASNSKSKSKSKNGSGNGTRRTTPLGGEMDMDGCNDDRKDAKGGDEHVKKE